jgi:hypothetical protein
MPYRTTGNGAWSCDGPTVDRTGYPSRESRDLLPCQLPNTILLHLQLNSSLRHTFWIEPRPYKDTWYARNTPVRHGYRTGLYVAKVDSLAPPQTTLIESSTTPQSPQRLNSVWPPQASPIRDSQKSLRPHSHYLPPQNSFVAVIYNHTHSWTQFTNHLHQNHFNICDSVIDSKIVNMHSMAVYHIKAFLGLSRQDSIYSNRYDSKHKIV